MPGRTSRLWPATSSSAGLRMPSGKQLENVAFAGHRRNWWKASVGPAAGRGVATASAPAGSGRVGGGRPTAPRRQRHQDSSFTRVAAVDRVAWHHHQRASRPGISFQSRRGGGGHRHDVSRIKQEGTTKHEHPHDRDHRPRRVVDPRVLWPGSLRTLGCATASVTRSNEEQHDVTAEFARWLSWLTRCVHRGRAKRAHRVEMAEPTAGHQVNVVDDTHARISAAHLMR